MTTIKKLTSLSVVALIGLWGCSTSQYTARNGNTYDDLYGSSSDVQVAARTNTNTDQRRDSRYANPEFQDNGYANNERNSNPDYYDESYLSTRNLQRQVSDQPGYNSGFQNGYTDGMKSAFNGNQMFRNNNSMYNSFGPSFGMGFQMGIGSAMHFGYSPFGMGGYGMGYSPFGYSPYGFNSFGYDPFYSPFGYGNSMAYGGYGNSPFGFGGGYSPFGYGGGYGLNSLYGYNPYYGGFGNRNFIVNNNYENGRVSRSYGPRDNVARSNSNSGYTTAPRTSQGYSSSRGSVSNARTNTGSSDSYYSRPRGNSQGTYYNGNATATNRSSADYSAPSSNARSSSTSDSRYYSSPRSGSTVNSSNNNVNRSSRSYESNSTYGQSRGNQTYQAPARSTYESSPRTSTPTFNSGSSRGSVSMPSSSPAPASAPRSRGPR